MPAEIERLPEHSQMIAMHMGLMISDGYHPMRRGMSNEDAKKLNEAKAVLDRVLLRRQEGGIYAKFYSRAAAAV